LSSPARAAAGLSVAALGALAAAAAIGYLPTVARAGTAARPAMLAGCLVAALGAAVGALPVLRAVAAGSDARPQATALWAMGLRFATTLGVAGVVWASDLVATKPLLAWVAIGYLVLLVVETRWTLRWLPAGAAK
jgi:hypothetical protein